MKSYLCTSQQIQKNVSRVKSKHRLVEQANSLRKCRDTYSTKKVNEIKQKYEPNLQKITKQNLKKKIVIEKSKENNNKQNLMKNNTQGRENGKLVKRTHKNKKELMGKRIKQLQGLNIKLHEMIINLKDDYLDMEEEEIHKNGTQKFEKSQISSLHTYVNESTRQIFLPENRDYQMMQNTQKICHRRNGNQEIVENQRQNYQIKENSSKLKKHKRQLSQSNINYLVNNSRVSERESRQINSTSYNTKSIRTHSSLPHTSHTQDSVKSQTKYKRFIKRLAKQIKYDQQFIKNKYKMLKRNIGKQKMQSILKNIQKILPQFVCENTKQLLEVDEEEMDPFYTQRQLYNQSQKIGSQTEIQRILCQQLIQSYVKSIRYWHVKVYKNFSPNQINLEGLDCTEQNMISKGDLARYMSLNAKNLYCNRDVCLIFKRIGKWNSDSWIQKHQFLENFSKPNIKIIK